MSLLVAAQLCGGPLRAAPMQFDCVLRDGSALGFAVDPAHFAPPVTRGEPPRQQVTQVQWQGHSLRAEAVLMQDGTAGFYHATRGLLGLVRPDGTLRVTEGDAAWHGRCTLSQ